MISEKKLDYSIIIPVFNEEGAIFSLVSEIHGVMTMLKKSFEIIVVNDGSTDNSVKEINKLKGVKLINLRTNFGQSVALDFGIKNALGKIIITIDGDGQNDPHDIPKLLAQLNDDTDFVCGWRSRRMDDLGKRIVSLGAAWIRKHLLDDGVHDAGCTLRVYKSFCFEGLDLNGEMHRMLPALLKWRGYRGTELKVNHRPRTSGTTKYGSSRVLKGFLDMLLVWFGKNYQNRPIHLFGSFGLILILISGLLLTFLAVLKIFFEYRLSDKIWPLVGLNGLLAGLQLLIFGVLADLTRKNSTKNNSWMIKKDES